MKFSLLLSLLIVTSCGQLKYKTTVISSFPELATVGNFKDYLVNDIQVSKTILDLKTPIRLAANKIEISKRAMFSSKDTAADSTLVYIKIVDVYSLVNTINQDKNLIKYLKNSDTSNIVTSIKVKCSGLLQDQLLNAEELYLVKNYENTLSLEIREDNSVTQTIEFSELDIVDIGTSNFCWGSLNGYKVKLADIVTEGRGCSNSTYKSAAKAQRKVEIKF